MQTLLKRLRTRWLKWREYDLGIRIENNLTVLERLGTPYGGWIIPAGWLHAGSVCYLVGAGEDVSFDVAVADRYGCDVHIFDPTPRAVRHVESLIGNLRTGQPTPCPTSPTGRYPDYAPTLADRLRLHPVGIWNEDTSLRFYVPQNDQHVSHSLVNLQHTEQYIEVPVRRLSSIMREQGHTRVDLLKLDIEGAEYQVLEAMLADGVEVDVLCIEFDESAANHLDTAYLDRIRTALEQLTAAGYRVVAREPDCRNYTLVHGRRFLPDQA